MNLTDFICMILKPLHHSHVGLFNQLHLLAGTCLGSALLAWLWCDKGLGNKQNFKNNSWGFFLNSTWIVAVAVSATEVKISIVPLLNLEQRLGLCDWLERMSSFGNGWNHNFHWEIIVVWFFFSKRH